MYRYEQNLEAVREERIFCVQRAGEGDGEAMTRLRTMALRAGVFAGLSVNSPVWRQEDQFAGWLRGEPITGLPAHQCVERIGAWIAASMTLDLFDDLSGAKFAEAACKIKYLGPAKSHFFAACMGFEQAPCVDVWMSRVLKERGVMKTKFAPREFAPYRRLVEASGWTTLHQWREFLNVPPQFPGKACFGETHHDVLFTSLLGPKAVTA